MRETMDIHTNSVHAKPQKSERKFLLSEMLGSKVFLHEKKIGTLTDLMIVETGRIPEVVNFVITRPFGDPPLLVPYEYMVTLGPHQLVIDGEDLKRFESLPPEDAILLRDHILDKKVLDTEDAEVEVVYDIRLVERNAKLYVTEVDTSKAARLRRLGFGFLSKFAPEKDPKDNGAISWMYIQPLPSHISSFKGDVKLRILKETLAEIHPVDLADIPVGAFVFTGHKALFGIPGIGGFFITEPEAVRITRQGGTGTDSRELTHPFAMPMRFEAGTHNYPGIASLYAGLQFITSTGQEAIERKNRDLTHGFIRELKNIPGVTIYNENPDLPVVSFNITALDNHEVGFILARAYNVILRTGLHCAPLVHERIDGGKGGIRASFSYFTSRDECSAAAQAIREVAESADSQVGSD